VVESNRRPAGLDLVSGEGVPQCGEHAQAGAVGQDESQGADEDDKHAAAHRAAP
jgi:hypothetical protein